MSWTHIQENSIQDASGTTSLTWSLTLSAVSANSAVSGQGTCDISTTIVSVKSDKGDTAAIVDIQTDPGNEYSVSYLFAGLTAGATVITMTLAAPAGFIGLSADEDNPGAGNVPVLDGHNKNLQISIGAGTNVVNSGAFTPSVSGDLVKLFATSTNGNGCSFAIGTSPAAFTARNNVPDLTGGNFAILSEDLVQATAASITPTASQTLAASTANVVSFGMAFKAVASGAISVGFGYSNFDPPTKAKSALRDFQAFLPAPGLPNQFFGNDFVWWPNAPRPLNFAKGWIEFYQRTIVGPPATVLPFTNFYPSVKPRNFSRDFPGFINAPGNPNQFFGNVFSWWPQALKPPYRVTDWITQFGNPPTAPSVLTEVGQPVGNLFFPGLGPSWNIVQRQAFPADILTVQFFFTPFDVPARPKNFAQDWIVFSGNITVESPIAITFGGFSPFDPAPAPRNLDIAKRDFQEFINAPGNPNQFFGSGHDWWPRAPSPPKNFAKDWIAFSGNISIEAPPAVIFGGFTLFDPASAPRNRDTTRRDFQTFINAPGNPNQFFGSGHDWWPRAAKPPYYAVDWITQFGNISVDTLPINPVPFSPFDPAQKPRNFGVDWIANLIPVPAPFNPMPFSPFGPAPKPRNFALDWVSYHPDRFFTATPTISTMFTSFADGVTAKLWTRSGQQPQWWTYSFISPPSPPKPPVRRDTHDGDWIRRRHKKPRHPPVYSAEYYDRLIKEQRKEIEQKAPPELRIPNLVIPLDRLISPIDIPSLKIDIPSLRISPPDRKIVPESAPVQTPAPVSSPQDIGNAVRQFAETIDKFAEAALSISETLLSELHQHEPSQPARAPVQAPLRRVENIMQKFADGIEELYKSGLSKKRVIYDLDGRPIGVEPIPDEDDQA